jgi:hypothetical protein
MEVCRSPVPVVDGEKVCGDSLLLTYCRVHLRPLTPHGYTRSLLLFLVPVVDIAFGFLPREKVEINWLKNILR